MVCLSNFSITKTFALASLPDNSALPNPQIGTTKPTNSPPKKLKQRQRQQQPEQPTIIQIERAIGAGMFRDSDLRDEQRSTVFNGLLPDSSDKFEGPVEKKLRETGEWLVEKTERGSASTGKGILVVLFQWFLPIWTLLLLVAAGVVKLPFSVPFLDDLIM